MPKHRNETFLVQLLERIVPTLENPIVTKKNVIEKINVDISGLPESFKNFKICHLSDLHNTNLFQNNPDLLEKIKQENVDILVISGDIAHDGKFDQSLKAFESLSQFIPYDKMFLTTGNHDFASYQGSNIIVQDFAKIQKELEKHKINVLRNETFFIKKNNQQLAIIGIDDPELQDNENIFFDTELNKLTKNINSKITKILISHRPEKFDYYSKYKIDLVFTGHAHGGQVIWFKNRGLIAPNQRVFPKYTNGLYQKDQTQMIVSPGVSNNHSVPRINNPGKIFIVELHQK